MLRVVIDAEPGHLNPVLDPDVWGYRVAHDLICEPLLRRRADSAAEGAGAGTPGAPGGAGVPAVSDSRDEDGRADAYEGVLAERFTVDSDGAGIDIALRKGVRFHDGKALTAHDVRATLELVLSAVRTAPRTQALLQDLYRVEVIGPERLRLVLRRPNGRLLQALAEVDILPAHLLEGRETLAQLRRRPVCTGPYRLHEWLHGAEGRLVLRRDPGYWGAAPALAELHFLVVPDAQRGLSLMRRGGAELLGRLPALYVPEQVEPTMLKGRLRKLEVPANQLMLILWNGRNPVLSKDTRRALSLLLDRPRLVAEVRHGLGQPLRLPPPLLGVAADALGPQVAAAEALLDQAGLRRAPAAGSSGKPGGRLFAVGDQPGKPVRLGLLLPAGSTEAAEVARRVVEALGRQDILVVPETLDFASLQGRLRRGAYDAAVLSYAWTGSPAEADLGPLLHRGGAQAVTGSEGPDLDAALDGVHRALSPDKRRAAQAALEDALRQAEPVTFLYRPRQLLLLDLRVRPASPPLQGDFPRLRALGLDPPPPPTTQP